MKNEVSFKKWNGARKEESGNETEWNEDWMIPGKLNEWNGIKKIAEF